MEGYIYLTKELNSDGKELLHNGLPKIGIGKTNDLDRRFYEHSHRGSKATIGVNFFHTFKVDDMDKTEREIHRNLQRLGFEVVNRISTNLDANSTSRTEVYSGRSNQKVDGVVELDETISERLITTLLKSILTQEEFIRINLLDFKPHFLQNVVQKQIDDLLKKKSSVNLIAELCARFGKTLTYLEAFRKIDADVMILPSFMHSVFSSFEAEIVGKYNDENIGKWSNFSGFKIIDTIKDNNWATKLKNNLGKCKLIIFVSLQTPEESLSKFDIIKNIDGSRKFIVVDEADFGAYTQKSNDVIKYINSDGDVPYRLKIVTSGTGIDKAAQIFLDAEVDDVVSVSYTEMLLTKKGESKYFLDEYLDEINDGELKTFLSDIKEQKDYWVNTLAYAPNINFYKMVFDEVHRLMLEQNLDEDLTGWNKLLSDVSKNQNIIKLCINGLWGKSGNITLDTLSISNAIGKDPKVVQFFTASPNNEELEKLAALFRGCLNNHIVRVLSGDTNVKNATAERIVKEDIKRCKEEKKDGVIILSTNMGSRSFSVSETDAVVLMFDNGSVASLIQKISRALTGGKDFYGNDKTTGNVISLSLDSNRVDSVDVFIVEESQKNKTASESISSVIRRIRRSVNIFAIDDNGDPYDLLANDEYYSELINKFNFEKLKNSQINLLPLFTDKDLRDLLIDIKNSDSKNSEKKDKLLKSKGQKFLDGKEKGENESDDDVDEEDFTKQDIDFLRQCVITINNSILSIAGIDDSVFGKKSFRKTLESISSDTDKKSEFIDLLGVEPKTVVQLLDKEVINENIIDLCLSKY